MNLCRQLLATIAVAMIFVTPLAAAVQPSSNGAGRERGFRLLHRYSTDDFDGGSQTWSATQDARGVMVFGNLAGILEFDGVWWRTILLSNESAAMSVARDADGRIVVGGIDELGYLKPDATGRMTFVSLVGQLPEDAREPGEVRRVIPTPQGAYFEGDTRGFLWSGDAISTIATFEPGPDHKSSAIVSDRLYVWTPGSVRMLGADGHLVEADAPERVRDSSIVGMMAFDEGAILVLTRDSGLLLWRDSDVTPFAKDASRWIERHEPTGLASLADGRIAVTTRRGGVLLLRRSGAVDEILDTSFGLPDDDVHSAFSDRDGSLWLTLNTGIVRVEATSPVSVIDTRAGLKGSINGLGRHEGTLYAATYDGVYTVSRAQPDPDATLGIRAPVRARLVAGIERPAWDFADDGDALLIGTTGGVLVLRDGEISTIAGTEGTTAYALVRSGADPDLIWLAMRQGLGAIRREGSEWRWLGLVQGIPQFVRTIVPTDDGTVWLGTIFDGLLRVRVGQAEAPGDTPVAGDIQTFGTGEINVSRVDGRVVAVWNNGIYTVDSTGTTLVEDPKLARFATGAKLFELTEDANGNVWLNTPTPTILIRQGDGSYRADDLLLAGIPGRDIQMIAPEPDGIVWIGTERALVRYEPDASSIESSPHVPLVRRVSATRGGTIYSGAIADGASKPSLPARFGRVRFECSPSSYEPGARFQYWLEPSELEWSDWTSEPFIEFTNLIEGDYVFHVRTLGYAGQSSPDATFAFRVLPPWYRTPWAWAIWASLFIASFFGYSRLRHRALAERARLLEVQVDDKTRELQVTVEELRVATDQIAAKNRELEVANERLSALSYSDGLTGIANRRHLEEVIDTEWRRAWRTSSWLAFILIDIDAFKQLNDALGHQAGDDCLKAIASYLQSAMRRSGDVVARHGGDEFAAVLPSTDLDGARHFAEEIRAGIETLAIAHPSVAEGHVTASIGVAALKPREAQPTDDLVLAADRALYRAKSAGRNRVESE